MAKDYEVELYAHPNIYQNNQPRKFKVCFSEPDAGINRDTGLLLLIPGYGGSSDSKVYKKMRRIFADQYNLVSIQCGYFGQEFMQQEKSITGNFSMSELKKVFRPEEINTIINDGKIDFSLFLQTGSKYNISCSINALLTETIENFNEMGIMQALDNLTAIFSVISIIKDNHLSFNTKRVITYGHSQGAFLCYLCNAFSPDLFHLIIDNSAWLFPDYLKNPRHLYKQIGQMKIDVVFDYLASHLNMDKDIMSLLNLYQSVKNKCKIISFQGTDDQLVHWKDKKNFCASIPFCDYYQVNNKDVDGEIFKSSNHGLDADFLKLFDKVMQNAEFDNGNSVTMNPLRLETSQYRYEVNYPSGMIMLSRYSKQ